MPHSEKKGILFTVIVSFMIVIVAGIEDEMNWHGKPLSAKAEESIKAITANMSSQGPWGLQPPPVTATVPAVDISNVKLSEPPNYKLGQQVL